MKGTIKIISYILIVTIVLSSFVLLANAESNNKFADLSIIGTNVENREEPLRHEPVCGTYPSHRMMSSGIGYVIKLDGSTYINAGCAWQCSRGGLVMVTEGDMYEWGMDAIGRYATLHGQEKINNNGCIIYGADSYGYTSSNSLPGYKFYLHIL